MSEDNDYSKNFALIIPTGVYLWPEGSPAYFVSPLDKQRFLEYCGANGIDLVPMTVPQREEELRKWKQL